MSNRPDGRTAPPPSYGMAAFTGCAVLVLYLATLAPTTAMWDASEYITAAYTLGIPHPPGNPFFVLVGRVASLVPGGSVALRINALAAACSAASAAIWFLVAERVLAGWSSPRWARRLASAVASVIGATAFTVWNQSVVNEKVYTVSLAFFAVVSWLTVRWCDDPDGRAADRMLVLIAYLIGLGYTNHPAGLLVGPAVAVAILVRKPRTLLRWRLVLAGVVALGIGLTPFALEPIRAAWHPVMNEGEPTGCTRDIGLSCTFSKTTAVRLMANINRDQYGKPDLSLRQAPFDAQMGMWWLYFKWQWLRDAHGNQPWMQTLLAVGFLLLGLIGGLTHWRLERASFWFFGPLVITVTFALVYYMNFKYGASQSPQLRDVAREVRDRDYFYLWSFSTWSVWVAIGLATVWRTVATRVMASEAPRWLATSPVLLIGVIPLAGNWRDASRAGETVTREWAHDLLNSVEPYGILITMGDNDTFPLWYAQEVEGVRRDVTVAVTSLLNTDWYPRGLQHRAVANYDTATGPVVYHDIATHPPRTPLFSLTDEELNAIPDYVDVRLPQLFQAGSLKAIVDPRRLEFGVPTRGDLMVLRLIKDNLGIRPLYISRTSGDYVDALGLAPYALMQGLAFRVDPTPVTSSPELPPVNGGMHVDVKRTRALWNGFGAPAAMIRRGDWVDRPSVGIPFVYISTALMLADGVMAQGDSAEARRLRTKAVEVAEAVRLMDLLMPQPATPPPVTAASDVPRSTTIPVNPH